MNKKLIYDCRTESIRKVTKEDLSILPPELFLYVVEIKDSAFNDVIQYKYHIRELQEESPSKQLDWFVSALEDKYSCLSITKRENAFLNNNGIPYNQRSRISFIERYWYLTKEEIEKRLEGEEE